MDLEGLKTQTVWFKTTWFMVNKHLKADKNKEKPQN